LAPQASSVTSFWFFAFIKFIIQCSFSMSDVTKLKLARIASSAAFWIAVGVLFLQQSGLSLPEAYQLLSLYYLAVVVFEFPTGVVGDHFSHKLAVVLGHFISGIALIAIAVTSGFWLFAALLVVAAIGITLVSGSDTALLHSLSKNFKKDQSQIKLYGMATVVVATVLGSLLATIDIRLPIMLTGVFNIVSGLVALSIGGDSPKNGKGNIFRTALASLQHIKARPIIMHLLVIGSVSTAFFVALKWFYNPLLEQMGIPLAFWGTIMGIGLLTPIVGIKLYRMGKRVHIITAFLLFVLSIVPIGVVQVAALSIGALYLCNLLAGYLDVSIDIKLNEYIQTSQRAGILSIGSLLNRLVASAYMPLAGFVLDMTSFFSLMLITALGILLMSGYSLTRLWQHEHPK